MDFISCLYIETTSRGARTALVQGGSKKVESRIFLWKMLGNRYGPVGIRFL